MYGTYSRGFKAGGITQLSSDPSQPPLYPYKPEYSNNFEIGVKNTFWDKRLRLNVAAFYTQFGAITWQIKDISLMPIISARPV